jgi:hypothetical protein
MAEPATTQPTDGAAAESVALDRLAERLALEFPDATADQITQTLREQHRRFEHSVIRDFVPIFVERSARRILRDDRASLRSAAD